jgi:hypothetical protein
MAYAMFISAILLTCLLYSGMVNAGENLKSSGVTTDTVDDETVSALVMQDNPVFTFVDNLHGILAIPEVEVVDKGHFEVELLLDFSTNQFKVENIAQLSEVGQASKPISEPSTPSVPVDVCKAEMAVKSGATHAYKMVGEPVIPDFGKLLGNYSDVGIDTDGDGLYNCLKLSVEVQIHESSPYNIVAWLENGSGTQMVWASAWGMLEVGSHTIDLFFDGLIIRDSGLDGPYKVNRVELRLADDHEFLADTKDNVYTTSIYQHSQFDAPIISFTNSFSDTTVDTNGDSLYDLLRINIGLEVQEAGTYTVIGEFESSDDVIIVVSQKTSLFTGSQNVNLDIDGQLIFQHQKNGPYYLRRLRVEDVTGKKIDFINEAYTTGAYTYTQFQHDVSMDAAKKNAQNNIKFTGNTTFNTVDDNGDGLAEAIIAVVEVEILVGGEYSFIGSLKKNGQNIANRPFFESAGFSNATLNEAPGFYTISLGFSGEQIYRSGKNGPYELELFAVGANGFFAIAPPTFTKPYDYRKFSEVEGTIMSITDVAIDDDGNGKLDFIETTVTVKIRTAGDYQLQGNLSNKEDISIINVLESFTKLVRGTHTLKLQFPGQNIRRSGLDGPYQGVVNLIESSKQHTIGSIELVTQSYLSNTFEVLLELDGIINDQGIDANDNGRFDILWVDFGVNITEAGTFLMRGVLTNQVSFVFTETLMTLSSGSQILTLNFPGPIIHEQKMDGPYEVEVGMLDSNTSYHIDRVRLEQMTKAYKFTDFEPLRRNR